MSMKVAIQEDSTLMFSQRTPYILNNDATTNQKGSSNINIGVSDGKP
ncbi:MAG: hypothetical protein AMDU1_APLC00102G0003 [Thermoplasmatales archaeon A-plasma]|jgi:hypothetical protein|nr:MAG: hypothetical protein AMDU1_APLC00102G0003 [Thermoplasmatales archaeon A-plasma]